MSCGKTETSFIISLPPIGEERGTSKYVLINSQQNGSTRSKPDDSESYIVSIYIYLYIQRDYLCETSATTWLPVRDFA